MSADGLSQIRFEVGNMELGSLVKLILEWNSTAKQVVAPSFNGIRVFKIACWDGYNIVPTNCIWNTRDHLRWCSWNADDLTEDLCLWLPVSMCKLGNIMTIDDKSGVERKICRCVHRLHHEGGRGGRVPPILKERGIIPPIFGDFLVFFQHFLKKKR